MMATMRLCHATPGRGGRRKRKRLAALDRCDARMMRAAIGGLRFLVHRMRSRWEHAEMQRVAHECPLGCRERRRLAKLRRRRAKIDRRWTGAGIAVLCKKTDRAERRDWRGMP